MTYKTSSVILLFPQHLWLSNASINFWAVCPSNVLLGDKYDLTVKGRAMGKMNNPQSLPSHYPRQGAAILGLGVGPESSVSGVLVPFVLVVNHVGRNEYGSLLYRLICRRGKKDPKWIETKNKIKQLHFNLYRILPTCYCHLNFTMYFSITVTSLLL